MREEMTFNSPSMGKYGMLKAQIWTSEKFIKT